MSSDDLAWRKSSFSGSQANCVQIGITAAGHAAGMRDSKRPDDGHLPVSADTFAALLVSIKRGELDLA
jgi:hypothetical protein